MVCVVPDHGKCGLVFEETDRKSTRLNSSHLGISYAVFCLKKKNHTSELKSLRHHVCRLVLEKKKRHEMRAHHLPLLISAPLSPLYPFVFFFFFFLKSPPPPNFPLFPPHALFCF